MRIVGKIIFVVASFFIVVAFAFLILRYQSNRPLQAVVANTSFSQHALSVYDDSYFALYHQYGLDLPPFYLSISNLALPDSFLYLPASNEKDFLIYWSCKSGSAKEIQYIYYSLIAFHNESWRIPPSQFFDLQNCTNAILDAKNADSLNFYFSQYLSLLPRESKTFSCLNGVTNIKLDAAWKQWLPTLHLHAKNQFSMWLSDCFKNGSGIYTRSWITKNSVGAMLKKPLLITFILTLITMFTVIVTSVFFAAELYLRKDKKWISAVKSGLHFLYSVPTFFIGAVLIFLVANPYQLSLVPANFSFAPFMEGESFTIFAIVKSWSYFILPVITLSFGAIVFFTMLLFSSFEIEFSKTYVLSAKMMGLSNRAIVYKYVLKNALYSTSTFLFLLFPALLSGAVVVEQLFSIAGVGSLLITAARSQDVPVLISLFGIIGFVTAICFMLLNYFQNKIAGRLLNKEVAE